jgi:hypothetical protein
MFDPYFRPDPFVDAFIGRVWRYLFSFGFGLVIGMIVKEILFQV